MKPRLSKPIARALIDAFNDACPPGSRVFLIRDDGSRIETITRSVAWLINEHTPIVKVDDVAGGYDLQRIVPIVGVPR